MDHNTPDFPKLQTHLENNPHRQDKKSLSFSTSSTFTYSFNSETQLWYRDLRMAILFTDGYRLCCILVFLGYCLGMGIIMHQAIYDGLMWVLKK